MAYILVVEDELEKPFGNNLFVELLRAEGHSIEFAETGDEALDRLIELRFDIVILDIMLPPSKEECIRHETLINIPRPNVGVTVLEMIKRGDFLKTGVSADVPVLIVSGVTGDRRWERIRKCVPDKHILTKPCSPELIVSLVQDILGI